MSLNTTTTIYGNKPTRSNKVELSSKSRRIYGFQFPIAVRIEKGYFSKSSGIDLIKNSLRQLLLTERGERVMLPDYGTNLKKYLMEPMDDTLFETIQNEILTSIQKYATNVVVTKLQIRANNGNFLTIKLFCKIQEFDNIVLDLKIEAS